MHINEEASAKIGKPRGRLPAPSKRLRAKRERKQATVNSLNLKTVRDCASIGMTLEEIADRLHVDPSWLGTMKRTDPDLEEALCDGVTDFKESLRRAQAKLALSGHPAMLIWLGKQFLGQTDKQDIKQENTVNIVLQEAVKELRELGRDEILQIKQIIEQKDGSQVLEP